MSTASATQWAPAQSTSDAQCHEAAAAAASSAQQSCASQARSASSSIMRPNTFDRFYGHRDLAELCERVIMALFACPLDSTSSSVNSPATPSSRPAPRLSEFIAYALHRTRLPLAVTHQALFLLKRLKSRFPAARGSSGHRLFISALMLASKSSCDDTYSNKSWTIVGQGLFSLREVNQMERELFAYLGFKVNVGNVELQAFVRGLDQGQIRSVGESPVVAASPPMPSPAPEVVAPPPVVQPTQHDQAVEAAAMSSPASSASSAGPHRASVAHRASRHGGSMSINNRASIAGYPASHSAAAAAAAATAANAMMGSGSAPPITSSSMARCASVKHDRPSSAHAHLHHSFGVNARDRGRPYTMPTHSMPLAGHSASAGGHYACQPRPSSLSSPSIASRGSISAGSSSGSSASATPSPSASHSVSSSSTTPDTPPSELAVSPYGHSGPFGPTSPSAMPAGTYEKTHGQFQLYLQNAQRGNYIHQLSQQELYTSAIPTA